MLTNKTKQFLFVLSSIGLIVIIGIIMFVIMEVLR